ncbi:MAG: DNA polymerase ligase N-terminal domain-containing protein [Conexivisphaerales archaeon]
MIKLKFVVHKHYANRAGLHYDLRIQKPDNKKEMDSYAIRKGIPETSGEKRLAIKQPVHDIKWLKFQGEIPEGEYGAGTLEIWDSGSAVLLKDTNSVKIYNFFGKKMMGLYSLVHLSGDNYLLLKNKRTKE